VADSPADRNERRPLRRGAAARDLQRDHAAEYLAQVLSVRPLPGGARLLAELTAERGAALLGVETRCAMVVGDSVWDLLAARRAGALGIGLLSGATAARNWSEQPRTGFMPIRPTCWRTPTKWACAASPACQPIQISE